MRTAHDIAAIIRQRRRDRLGLQKLLYYAQAWCLAETGEACFDETIEAWVHGPVVAEVWRHAQAGDPSRIAPAHLRIIEDVLDVYGVLPGDELVETTHAEPGWLRARQGLEPKDRSNNVVELASVVRFLKRSKLTDRRDRMRDALRRSQERAHMRKLMEPHRETMMRLAQ